MRYTVEAYYVLERKWKTVSKHRTLQGAEKSQKSWNKGGFRTKILDLTGFLWSTESASEEAHIQGTINRTNQRNGC